MSDTPITILRKPQLSKAEDYTALRRDGLTAIEELGSALWTDYNTHDPGITTLEALCYALVELGYRSGFDIADLLTEESGYISFRQALFSARRILTNNALTVNDLRKVLIDQPKVANGWLLCKQCACETTFYAECKESTLFHAPQWRLNEKLNREAAHEHPVHVLGMYDVLLQLETDATLGNLNNRKLTQTIGIPNGARISPLTIEFRFPDWQAEQPELYSRFVAGAIETVQITRFSRDRTLAEPVNEAAFVQGWRNLFFADFDIAFRPQPADPLENVVLTGVPIRFFSPHEDVKRVIVVQNLLDIMADATMAGIIGRYHQKLAAVAEAVAQASQALHEVRNLGEDYCRLQAIKTEDIAACADVEVSPDADIEYVLARIFYEIEQHFNPPVPFYALSTLLERGIAVEDIFLGPALENGFILEEDLEKSPLLAVIHVSDLYNRLMDIPGLTNITNLQFTRYDDLGNPIMPSQIWTIPVRPLHIPLLYQEASRVLFYKNGLPFLPRMDEVQSILAQLRGRNAQNKLPLSERDLAIPVGVFRDLSTYVPVQHTYPLTYGIGPHGLPPEADNLRRAQAKQLKAFLMPFEQLIADANAQLAAVGQLFSTDESVDRTYFNHFFDPAANPTEIADLPALLTAEATEANLHQITEPLSVFHQRRNRFLDHLMARFGEQFRDYALMLYANADRIPFAPEKLIKDKIRFLRFYPRISANRGKAFHYKDEQRICDPRNKAGLEERISRLLGLESLLAYFNIAITSNDGVFSATFALTPGLAPAGAWLTEEAPIDAATGEEAESAAWESVRDVIAYSADPANYVTDGDGVIHIQDGNGQALAQVASGVTVNDMVDFCSDTLRKERLYIIEHLLLRPKFPGDALLPVCLEPECSLCGQEDPYSFRLTYVLQGALEPFNYDIDLRRFADNTIRRETPAHLLPKICWVGNRSFKTDPCHTIYSTLANLLAQALGGSGNDEDVCQCALDVYAGFELAFQTWVADQTLALRSRGQWESAIQAVFAGFSQADFPCLSTMSAAVWDRLRQVLLAHFVDAALYAYQFDRLEVAWCAWLESNAPFNWQAETEQLQARTEALLRNSLGTMACQCAGKLLGYFGDRFRLGILNLIDQDLLPDDETAVGNLFATARAGFMQGLATIVTTDPNFCHISNLLGNGILWNDVLNLWQTIYTSWVEVSWRLTRLIAVFSELKSVYPTATLHDCDDGADDNPVRLDSTTLGSL